MSKYLSTSTILLCVINHANRPANHRPRQPQRCGGGHRADITYVADFGNGRVLKLPAGSASQEVLPFTSLRYPGGVAADAAGNVYVTDTGTSRVLKLPKQ